MVRTLRSVSASTALRARCPAGGAAALSADAGSPSGKFFIFFSKRKTAARKYSASPQAFYYLLAVAIRVAGHGALNRIADTIPRVSRGVLGAIPTEARFAACAVPVARQIRFDLIETATWVLLACVDAVAVGRPIVVKGIGAVDIAFGHIAETAMRWKNIPPCTQSATPKPRVIGVTSAALFVSVRLHAMQSIAERKRGSKMSHSSHVNI